MSKKVDYKSYIEELIKEVEDELDESTATGNVDGYQTPFAFSGNRAKDKKKAQSNIDVTGYTKVKDIDETVNEAKSKRPVNRWLELKNDESMHPNKKLAVGLKELKYQLSEVETFFRWYNQIKTMNELTSDTFWKRTHSHIYKIKERLVNIAKTIQEIEH
jgi:hypothetical protein